MTVYSIDLPTCRFHSHRPWCENKLRIWIHHLHDNSKIIFSSRLIRFLLTIPFTDNDGASLNHFIFPFLPLGASTIPCWGLSRGWRCAKPAVKTKRTVRVTWATLRYGLFPSTLLQKSSCRTQSMPSPLDLHGLPSKWTGYWLERVKNRPIIYEPNSELTSFGFLKRWQGSLRWSSSLPSTVKNWSIFLKFSCQGCALYKCFPL